uniref:Uncharacterized protein n=1 Tax=Anguilla anguilla TaxID=7936 RepID=A0A0E9RWI1_ANGAN
MNKCRTSWCGGKYRCSTNLEGGIWNFI